MPKAVQVKSVFLTSEPRAWARWAGPGKLLVRPGLPYLMALTSEPRTRARPSGPGKLLGRARAWPVVRNTAGEDDGKEPLQMRADILPVGRFGPFHPD
jgi:hypothetical protein